MTRRLAIYAAPGSDHPLWHAGCAWLGRDPTGDHPGVPPPQGLQPWRYGFHATLKAPIALADGCDEHDFCSGVAQLARRHAPFVMPPLAVGSLGGFVALRLLEDSPALRRLADACVTELDRWRRPMEAPEFERRARGLGAPGRALLRRWGYAHVLQDWRFHMTLSDPLDDTGRAELMRRAQAHFAPALAVPWVLDSLCLFEEPGPGQPMRLTRRFRLGSGWDWE